MSINGLFLGWVGEGGGGGSVIDDVKVFHVSQAMPVYMGAVPSEGGASDYYSPLTSSLPFQHRHQR